MRLIITIIIFEQKIHAYQFNYYRAALVHVSFSGQATFLLLEKTNSKKMMLQILFVLKKMCHILCTNGSKAVGKLGLTVQRSEQWPPYRF